MRKFRIILRMTIFIILVALSGLDHAGAFGARRPERDRYSDVEATVTRVVDCNTVEIDIADGERETTRVRLLGLDCPTLATMERDTTTPREQSAEEYLRIHVAGKRVRLVLEPRRGCRDRSGCIRAYLYVADTGEMLNEKLLDLGMAYADTRVDHVMKFSFVQRERQAALHGSGFWKGIAPEKMPEWRRRSTPSG